MANFEIPKIKNLKIPNLWIALLLFMKIEIRQVYNPF